jgi:pimeloyl-ACP methyl ester carboxylesterase
MPTRDRNKRGPETSREDREVSQDLQALDHPVITSFIFHARKDASPPPSGTQIQDRLFPVEEHLTIGSRFYISNPRDPIILYFHGNGEIASDYDGIAPLYVERHMNLLVVDYRGYGRSTGTPSISTMILDARVVLKAAKAMLLSEAFTGGLWVMGRSLGSAPALQVARDYGTMLEGLIVESGFADTLGLLRRVGAPVHGLSISEPSAYFNLTAIRQVTIPTLIIHGERDQIIPLSDGSALFEASAALRKELVVIPQAGHNDLMWLGLERYMGALERFVRGET